MAAESRVVIFMFVFAASWGIVAAYKMGGRSRATSLRVAAPRMLSTGAYNIKDVMEDVKDGRAQLVDCREPHEWMAGHLLHAKLAPLSVLQQGILPDGIEPDEKIYLHCAAGVRVHHAAPLMRGLGCAGVVPLQEGFNTLLKLGMPPDQSGQ
jgi:rhodanese-related sulfurtransferase